MAAAALAATVNRMSISVPLGSGDYDAPGFLHLGHYYSCIPDAQYPWDPLVLAAVREICPDAMPLVIRSVWRWSNYNEHGHLDEELVLTRHGIGRAIRDSFHTLHDFYCEMPGAPVPGLVIPGRSLADCRPNYIEVNWHDADVKPYGNDLPGEYVAFDWRLYHRYRDADETRNRALAASREEVDDAGNWLAVGAATATVSEERAARDARQASSADDRAYINRDISAYYSEQPSDVEMKEALVGNG